MIKRFLRYSLERERKITVIFAKDMKKVNLLVTGISDDGFTARLPGRKKETQFAFSDVLTAAYARGDQGELE